VQEEERVAGAERGAGIHRRAAAAWHGDDAVGERPGELRGAVVAAAVGDDDLGAAARNGASAANAAAMIAASLSTGTTMVSRPMAPGMLQDCGAAAWPCRIRIEHV
jgi:hypothetical protein